MISLEIFSKQNLRIFIPHTLFLEGYVSLILVFLQQSFLYEYQYRIFYF